MLHDIHTGFEKNLEDPSVTLQRQTTQNTISEYQGVETLSRMKILGLVLGLSVH
jgi:hypothetical protein